MEMLTIVNTSGGKRPTILGQKWRVSGGGISLGEGRNDSSAHILP